MKMKKGSSKPNNKEQLDEETKCILDK